MARRRGVASRAMAPPGDGRFPVDFDRAGAGAVRGRHGPDGIARLDGGHPARDTKRRRTRRRGLAPRASERCAGSEERACCPPDVQAPDPDQSLPARAAPAFTLPLRHPLPVGMRDFLPAEARERAALAARVTRSFTLHGYCRVVVPAFEHAAVLERGLGGLDGDEVLRFVEPETGEILALRPDLTPQIARLIVTRLLDEPAPVRLYYHGSVWRRRRARARRHQQIPQAGIELVGPAATEGDLEVVRVGAAAVRAAGLERFVIDIGHVGVAAALLADVPAAARGALVDALALKDRAALVHRAERVGVRGSTLEGLAALPELHGGVDVWARAERALGATAARGAVDELRRSWERICAEEPGVEVRADLGETSRFDYYSGMTCQLFAEGPGEAIGSGGRYDELLARFGAPRPAAGIALDLDNLAWALARAGVAGRGADSLVIAGSSPDVEAMARELRARGIACVVGPGVDPAGYGRAWQHSHVLVVEHAGMVLSDLVRGVERRLSAKDPPGAAAEVAATVKAGEVPSGLP